MPNALIFWRNFDLQRSIDTLNIWPSYLKSKIREYHSDNFGIGLGSGTVEGEDHSVTYLDGHIYIVGCDYQRAEIRGTSG